MTSSSPSSSSSTAPWRADFLEHTSKMSQASFVLSTVRQQQQQQQHPSGGGGLPSSPRARTCILRGMWATLPANEHNKAPRNRPAYESDLPVFTTDARMAKAADLGLGTAGTGAAGPVEAVWWAEESQTQWRVRGDAWLLGGGGLGIPAAAKAAIEARMRRTAGKEEEEDEEAAEEWSWEREVTAHFGNLNPFMRGTFRNPPPGTPRHEAPGPGEGLGQQVEDLEDELARRNFMVCVIVPTEVDRVLLTKDPRRWLYRFVATEGKWKTVELWP